MQDLVYHIAQRTAWDAAQESGLYQVESLQSEGFIHCSTLAQILPVANGFYGGKRGLVLLCIDVQRVQPEVRYKSPAHPDGTQPPPDMIDTDLFPHIYGALNMDAVVRVVDFPPDDDGMFTLPL